MISVVGTGGKFIPDITLLRHEGGVVSGREVPIDVRESTIALIKDGLYGVANEDGGTARWSANSSIVPISGKTGTAQVMSSTRGPDHAWFVAYAPSDSPEIAVSVLVEEGGHGSSAAAPIAKTAIETYIKGKQDANRPKSNTEL
jgi:penicillin-binding protein 2